MKMKKIWYSFVENELLTTEEQLIDQRQKHMSFGFWIGYATILILLSLVYII